MTSRSWNATEFGEVGAGLQIGPNAARIMQHWGLLDELLTHGVKPDNLVLNDAVSGQELTRQDLGEDFRRRYGAPYLVVHRSDLHRILLEACERVGVVLHTDHLVDEVISSNDTATIGCTNGSTFHSDIVIAADGFNSRLRQRMVADTIVPSVYVAYRGTFPISEVPDASELNDVIAWLGPKCHFVQYPLRQGEMLNQVAVFRSPSFDDGNPEWGGPAELDEAFAGCSDAVKRVLPYLWRDRHWQMADRNPTENWIDGRVVLLGAAHPPLQYLAQGVCMAIEDAACLSAEGLDFVTTLGPGKGWDQAMESSSPTRTVGVAGDRRLACGGKVAVRLADATVTFRDGLRVIAGAARPARCPDPRDVGQGWSCAAVRPRPDPVEAGSRAAERRLKSCG